VTDTATPLRTGCEPAAAVDDTVVRQALLAHVARAERTVRAVGGRWEIDDDVALADLYLPGVSWAAATAQPASPAVLLASDDGRPMYEGLGFVAVTRWTLWTRPAH
jgi:hypothetical protein